jgi:uncharacterized protein
MKRFLRFFLPILSVLLIAGYYSVDQGAPYMVIKPRKHSSGPTPEQFGASAEHFQFRTKDSIALSALYMPKQGDSARGTIICLHGIGNNKNAWVETALMLNDWGYNALLYDSRAHGESGGEYCTLGYYEKEDVRSAVDWLEQNHPMARVGIMGNSMGGAVALQALAVESRLKFGLIECPFAELESVVLAYQKRYAGGFQFRELTMESLEKAGKIAHFDPKQVCPVCIAPQIKQPILMLHGTKDINISPDNTDRIFEALGSAQKEKMLIEGADHYSIMSVGGDAVREKMHSFLDGAQ